jgi:hypothetical protein
VISRLSTTLALILDIHVSRSAARRGIYNSMNALDQKQPLTNTSREHLRSNSNVHTDIHNSTDPFDHEIHGSEALEIPEYTHTDTRKPYSVQRPIDMETFGYMAPTEQTAYDPAGVHGDLGKSGRYADGGA